MLIATENGNFTVGAILSWGVPITLLIVILVWWGITLAIRALRARQQNTDERRGTLSANSVRPALGGRLRLRRVVWAAAAACAAGIAAAAGRAPAARGAGLAGNRAARAPRADLLAGRRPPGAALCASRRARRDDLARGPARARHPRRVPRLALHGDVPVLRSGDQRRRGHASGRGPGRRSSSSAIAPADDAATNVRAAMRRWHAPAGWHWLTGTSRQLDAVWRAYGIERGARAPGGPARAALYLIDARGYERAGYLPPILPTFLALDIERLEGERTTGTAGSPG